MRYLAWRRPTRETRAIPIVFVNTVDPVAAGLVSGLARPDSNITGSTSVRASDKRKVAWSC